eukprot:2731977-Rhodomonas_salina.1
MAALRSGLAGCAVRWMQWAGDKTQPTCKLRDSKQGVEAGDQSTLSSGTGTWRSCHWTQPGHSIFSARTQLIPDQNQTLGEEDGTQRVGGWPGAGCAALVLSSPDLWPRSSYPLQTCGRLGWLLGAEVHAEWDTDAVGSHALYRITSEA